jgi:peptidyl-prolyl cis-trans isomerase A (cyclophilin A)
MRSTCSALLLVTLVVGCEHKSKKDDNTPSADKPMGSASGVAKPSGDDMKPEPVGKAPGTPPPPATPPSAPPAGNDNPVRAPVAADLAEYTKDLTGNGPLTATIETSMGAFHCELFGDKAPLTVANFVGLATGKKPWKNPTGGAIETSKPFFDGLIFHRVIPGFMIQGGDPIGSGTGGPGYEFVNEVNNGLVMKPGTLAMANAGPDTNGSQFFITEGTPSELNNKYTIFGQCKEVDLVRQIASQPRGRADRPDAPVAIKKITFAKG